MGDHTLVIPSTEEVLLALDAVALPVLLIIAIVFMVNALYGYRIFRYSLAIGGAISCGTLGGWYLGSWIVSALGDKPIVTQINIPAIVGILCALIGGILMFMLFKVAIFLSGAAGGYLAFRTLGLVLAEKMPDVEFIHNEVFLIVASIVGAVLIGVLFIFLFKPIYILITSVGGMVMAAMILGSAVTHEPNKIVVIIFAVFGLVGGAFAAVKQGKDTVGM